MKYDPWELAFPSILGFTECSSILRWPSSARYLRDNCTHRIGQMHIIIQGLYGD